MSVPGSLLLPFVVGVTNEDGRPLAGGKLYTYLAGTSDEEPVFEDVLLQTEHANPIILDSLGRATIYLGPTAYKLVLTDAAGAGMWVQDNVEDVGQVFVAAEGFGRGEKNVTNGYQITDEDSLVTVLSTGGPDPCEILLPSAASRTTRITIKNIGTVDLSIVPDDADTIEGAAAAFAVPAASGTDRPAITLSPDPDESTAWHITGSHKVP
jgi:hypothetical protein